MKKLKIRNTYFDNITPLKEMSEKINEIIGFLEPIPATDLKIFCRNKEEIERSDKECGYVDDEEWEVIKKCLRYCYHRLTDHDQICDQTGIQKALSSKDKKIFKQIINNL